MIHNNKERLNQQRRSLLQFGSGLALHRWAVADAPGPPNTQGATYRILLEAYVTVDAVDWLGRTIDGTSPSLSERGHPPASGTRAVYVCIFRVL